MAMMTYCIEKVAEHKLEQKLEHKLENKIDQKLEHQLDKKNYKRSYTCYGCEEQGFGVRYRCEQCSYEFHEDCVHTNSCKQSLSEMFRNREFSFMLTPPERPGQTLCCNACGNVVKGFVFYSGKSSTDVICLHPCCTKLKKSLEFKNMKFTLINMVEGNCILCDKIKPSGGKINGWSYRSACKTKASYVHVSCVTKMALAKEMSIYMNYSITNRTSLALKNLRQPTQHKNNDGGTNMAKEVCGFIAETIFSTILGDPTTLIASSILHFFWK